MKDIKELIYAAVEENAVKFQELVNAQLQVRAYDAIEALRPEVGASMFGEAKKMEDDEEEMEDEDEDEEMEDEDEMDDKKKSMKEALHTNQQKIDVVDDEKIDAKDFAKLRQMKKMKEEVEQIDEAVFDSKDAAQSVANKLKTKHDDGNYHVKADNGKHRVVHAYYPNSKVKKQIAGLKEEVKQVNERSREDMTSQIKGLKKTAIKHGYDWPHDDSTDNVSTKDLKTAHKSIRSVIKQGLKAKAKAKADVQEVAMPKNAADWQAMINHQIQIAGHPVATDAQFRATIVGKDMSKMASLEPGQDALQYATAQGGTVKLP